MPRIGAHLLQHLQREIGARLEPGEAVRAIAMCREKQPVRLGDVLSAAGDLAGHHPGGAAVQAWALAATDRGLRLFPLVKTAREAGQQAWDVAPASSSWPPGTPVALGPPVPFAGSTLRVGERRFDVFPFTRASAKDLVRAAQV